MSSDKTQSLILYSDIILCITNSNVLFKTIISLYLEVVYYWKYMYSIEKNLALKNVL